jgi:hypothetical protein
MFELQHQIRIERELRESRAYSLRVSGFTITYFALSSAMNVTTQGNFALRSTSKLTSCPSTKLVGLSNRQDLSARRAAPHRFTLYGAGHRAALSLKLTLTPKAVTASGGLGDHQNPRLGLDPVREP